MRIHSQLVVKIIFVIIYSLTKGGKCYLLIVIKITNFNIIKKQLTYLLRFRRRLDRLLGHPHHRRYAVCASRDYVASLWSISSHPRSHPRIFSAFELFLWVLSPAVCMLYKTNLLQEQPMDRK